MPIIFDMFYIIWSTTGVMPEQQKIDETIEASRSSNKKKLSKIEQSSTSLENQRTFDSDGVGSENITDSSLETQDEELNA
ncbi:hypothetical protein [Candidatus Nitrosocosmicus franklandus]|uniref:Uncharacterized protein n=1 Tax=Candidatus Nitrosocosmicus franklandianus TaxID=1798806 RepID=A0A484IBN2_9ARCH|nr:hypothetical protein [Candidatus Nitrosocosmicus franklandus]VFJ13445.1 conserved protein of unknown function [Candidatus Nitrosocosmicus franklandus]